MSDEAYTSSTLTLSNTSLNPGDSITATISMVSVELSHKITFSVGSKSHSVTLAAGVSTYSYTIPLFWANQLSGTSGTVNVKLFTYNGSDLIGTEAYSFKLVIPDTDSYKPTFDLKITRNDNGVPSSWGEYVKGVSTVTVEPVNITYKNGATDGFILIEVGKVAKTEIPATFDLTSAGSVVVKVTVKDSRGLTTVKTHVLTVRDYSPPSVAVNSLSRCNSDGTLDSFGTCAKLDFDHAYSTVNAKNNCYVTIRYKKTDATSYSGGISSKSSPLVIGANSLAISSTYMVSIVIKDDITTDGVEIIRYISSSNIPFNIRKGGNGAAFGKFSESDGLLDVDWDMNVNGDLTVNGLLNSTELVCTATEKADEVRGVVKYFPALNMMFIRLRIKVSTGLAATDVHYLAQLEKSPAVITPINALVGYGSGGQANGAVFSGSGYVVIRSDTPIETGSLIYISGWCPADHA